MKKLILSTAILIGVCATTAFGRDVSNYNLDNGIGLKGYDPVSFQSGASPLVGSADLALDHKGVRYNFTSVDNQQVFLQSPSKFESTYGGWCAYAMAKGSLVDINPQHFLVVGQRIHFFVSGRAKRNFQRNVVQYEQQADDNWKEISGEDPTGN